MKPKIYSKNKHHIVNDRIDSDALAVISRLKQAGYQAYAVGGCVRDLLLNKQPKDVDISTSAKPEEIKNLFHNCILIGRRFRLAHIRFGSKVIEVSTFRAGDNQDDSLITQDNIWGTEEEDVLRRDFTINGLYYDPEENTIIDYVNGYEDIEAKLLRTIGNPNVRFKQDPVRMIRLLKFIARFNLTVEMDTEIAFKNDIDEIRKSSSDRILGEIFKMLETNVSHSFFSLMSHYGLMQILFPKIGSFLIGPKKDQVYQLLKTADEQQIYTLEKPVLFSCLIFPLIEQCLQNQYSSVEEAPHLGEIFSLIHDEINTCFAHPFPRFPRWIRKNMHFILTMQYRFTPIDNKKRLKMHRLFLDKNFSSALRFLWLRAHIDEECMGPYTKIKKLSSSINKKTQNPAKIKKKCPNKKLINDLS